MLGILGFACSSTDSTSETPSAGDPTEPAPSDETAPSDPAAPSKTLPAHGTKGCGASAPGTGVLQRTVRVGSSDRTYVLQVPAKYDAYRAYPLTFVLHSGGGNGMRQLSYFGFDKLAENDGLFVYPDGKGGEWDLDTPADQNDDVAFFDAMVAELGASFCVDDTRLFATGSSMGGYFSNQLGCSRGDVLRAIAPHAGGGPFGPDSQYDDDGNLKCKRPVAAMVFHGLADTNVDPEEGRLSVKHWAWANGCKSTSHDDSPSPCVAYDGCQNPVKACYIPNQGHKVWDQGPQATWEFFSSF